MGSYDYPVFRGCSSLVTLNIGENVQNIPAYAFSGCSSLTSVTIPNSVAYIGDYAFYGCSGLLNVTLNCKNIGSWFSGNKSITELVIGEDVESIGGSAFEGCSGLTSVTIGNSVTSIGSSAFSGCFGLTSVTIPNSVTSIGSYAFRGCSGLTSVTIPNSVTSIGERAYSGCSGLQSVVIGNGVTSLPDYVFSTGKGLKSLTIGSGVLSISQDAFRSSSYNSTSYKPIKTIWLTNTPPSGYSYAAGTVNYVANEQYGSMSGKVVYPFLSSIFEEGGVKYVPVSPSERTCDAIDCVYRPDVDQLNISDKVSYRGIEMTVENVRSYCCYGNEYLKTVDYGVPNEIGAYAFANRPSLESFTMTDAPTGISNNVFSGCSSLSNVTMSDAVVEIGSQAFRDCSVLPSLQLSTSLLAIGESAFQGCASLTAMEIPMLVSTIGNNSFKGCTSLSLMVIADRDSLLKLGCNGSSPLFADCPLDSVYIGGNIAYNTSSSSGYSPFYRNTSLRAVVITDKETEISENEFYGCTNLQDVKIGDGVESFGDWTFSGCSSLKNFSFGMSVETIGKEAFSDCTAMESIFSRSPEPPVCGSQALDDINKWNCVLTVPAGNVAAYKAADQWKEFFFIEEGEAVQKYISVTIEKSEGGKVLVNGAETAEGIKTGSDVELTFIADEGYSLSQVLVNGDDVTEKVTDGKYTVTAATVDLLVKVTFSVNKYTLTYFVDGEEYKSLQVDYGTAITPEPAPEKEGYSFSGWSEIPETMPAHDVTVKGTFNINSYTLTYLIDGEVYKEMVYEYGAAITPESAPVKEGYTFSGWNDLPETMPAHDMTVTGAYIPNDYPLVYILDGNEYKTVDVPFGTAITPEPAPEKEGYTFSGWMGLPETMPAKMVIVTGTFSVNSYTLTYMIDDEVYKVVEYEYGAKITPEPAPAGDYIAFEWVGLPETMPAHDVIVHASYETSIADLLWQAEQGLIRIFSPEGKPLKSLQKGVNIVKKSYGSVRKVFVK